jgi:hypothetical protein
MGADKNSSPKRELGLYPKFIATDSHTSLPRSRSHNGPTNPRNKPQTIPKWKHEARSKGHSCAAGALADSLRPCGERSAITVRTVRDPRRTVCQTRTERPNQHLDTQTVRTTSLDGARATRAARTVCDVRADSPPNTLRAKATGHPDRNQSAQEHATNMKNTWTNYSTRKVREHPTDGLPGTGTTART